MPDNISSRRYPIIITDHCIALLELFIKPHDHLDDVWSYDYLEEEISNEPQFAADEFVRRLENHWTPAFMMALRKAITNKLIEHDQEFGTNFADRV